MLDLLDSLTCSICSVMLGFNWDLIWDNFTCSHVGGYVFLCLCQLASSLTYYNFSSLIVIQFVIWVESMNWPITASIQVLLVSNKHMIMPRPSSPS